MDVLYGLFSRLPNISVFDSALLLALFYLVRERLKRVLGGLKQARERIARLEKALLIAGIHLGNIEREQ